MHSDFPHIKEAVAAAASVPSSFTSTKALWVASDRNSSLIADMPGKKGNAVIKKYEEYSKNCNFFLNSVNVLL